MESNLQKLEEGLKTLEDRRTELFKLQAPINNELHTNYNKLEVIKNKIGKLKLASSKVVDWGLLLTEGNGDAVYKRYDRELINRGLFGGGMLMATEQRCIKIKLTKNSKGSLLRTIMALKEILPSIRPFPDGEHAGYQFIDIMESTLSEYGTYYLLINEAKHIYRVMKDAHRRTTELKRFKSLERVIKYVQDHHPYEIK